VAAGIFSGTVSFATNDPSQNPFNFTITGTASVVLTLDDNDGGFSATSGWQSYVGAGLGNEIRFKQAGSGSQTATWTFSGLNPGQYRVWTTWVPFPIGSLTRRTPSWMERRRWGRSRSTSN
jgi:hypothetical protein